MGGIDQAYVAIRVNAKIRLVSGPGIGVYIASINALQSEGRGGNMKTANAAKQVGKGR